MWIDFNATAGQTKTFFFFNLLQMAFRYMWSYDWLYLIEKKNVVNSSRIDWAHYIPFSLSENKRNLALFQLKIWKCQFWELFSFFIPECIRLGSDGGLLCALCCITDISTQTSFNCVRSTLKLKGNHIISKSSVFKLQGFHPHESRRLQGHQFE